MLGTPVLAFVLRCGMRGLCHGNGFVAVAAHLDLMVFQKNEAAVVRVEADWKHRFHERVRHRSRCFDAGHPHRPRDGVDRVWGATSGTCKCSEMLKQQKAKVAATLRGRIDDAGSAKIAASPRIAGSPRIVLYRSATMRAAYLAVDHLDISETSAKQIKVPRSLAELRPFPRSHLTLRSGHRTEQIVGHDQAMLNICADSDWVGDAGTQQSATGIAGMHGKHVLRRSSSLQEPTRLSPAEAEYDASHWCAALVPAWVCKSSMRIGA